MQEINVAELKRKMDAQEKFVLLDVREQYEHELSNIGGILFPVGQFITRLPEIKPEDDIVVYCHHGNRSAMAVAILHAAGYKKAVSLRGGIEEWSLKIDPSIKRY